MSNLPLVSVIVPCYNVSATVEKCVRSILSQSYSNLEIICVDDGSTDGTPSILKGLLSLDSRVTVITHDVNRGLYHARLTGVHSCHGDYISFVDSDDYVSSDFYRCLVEKATSCE